MKNLWRTTLALGKATSGQHVEAPLEPRRSVWMTPAFSHLDHFSLDIAPYERRQAHQARES